MTDEKTQEEQVKEAIENAKKLVDQAHTGTEETLKTPVNNDAAKIRLGDLGEFPLVPKEEVDELFEKIDGFIFKIKGCIFKVTYINHGQRKFSATLMNEKKD